MMLTGTHHATRQVAEAYLAENDWTEFALDTWASPCGLHIASLRNVEAVAIDVAPAPIVAVSVEMAVRQ